jgi:isopenicillin-N epimerase
LALKLGDFPLDPDVTFLNHGSFGSCPRPVRARQDELRERLERAPVRFLYRELDPLLDEARAALAAFLGAAPADLVFVNNATSGVNAVLRSLRFAPGDELLTTNHAYNACRNVLDWVAARAGARVVVAEVPFPLEHEDQVVDAVLAAASPRTRLALIDHVTSPTGLVFPVRRLVPALEAAGIDVLVDGAHAPGMLPLDLFALDAAYYTGNCHKWLCAPKGAGFLVTRRDRQEGLVPPVISHGLNAERTDRSRYHLLFDWTGTTDPSAVLSVPTALSYLGSLRPGGFAELRAENHALAVAGRRLLLERLGRPVPCPEEMLGSLAAIPLGPGNPYALHHALIDRHRIEVPVFPWPGGADRVLRFSAAVYNELSDLERLAQALLTELPRPA